jgi:hypothetical protein
MLMQIITVITSRKNDVLQYKTTSAKGEIENVESLEYLPIIK